MRAAETQQRLRDLLWLMSDSHRLSLASDYWGMLLRRVRHEKSLDIRDSNEQAIGMVDECLGHVIGGEWRRFEGGPAAGLSPSVGELLLRSQALVDHHREDELAAWWAQLKQVASSKCKNAYQCSSYREQCRTQQCFPCPALIHRLERVGVTPEVFIYRLNRPSGDRGLTFLGTLIEPFVSPKVMEHLKAVYFTCYYPGTVFHDACMGWTAIEAADRALLADSWNFIHWASDSEMREFCSPSRAIQGFIEGEAAGGIVDDYWIIPASVLDMEATACTVSEATSRYRQRLEDSLKYLLAKHGHTWHPDHALRGGFSLVSGACYDGDARVGFFPCRASGPAESPIWLDEIVRCAEPSLGPSWRQDLREQFLRFARRVFCNPWPCRAYVRLPVLPDAQLDKGADVFAAFDTDDPKTIIRGMAELTEPLALCASVIGGRVGYRAAAELEVDVGYHLIELIRHEHKHRLDEIEFAVRPTSSDASLAIFAEAVTDCRKLSRVFQQQLTASRILGLPSPDLVNFSDLMDSVSTYLSVLPRVALKGFVASPIEAHGFGDTTKIDRRVVLMCILLLQNAAHHSCRGAHDAMPGVSISISSTGEEQARVVVRSWYSPKSDAVLRASFATARSTRPRQSFDALLVIARDLNGDHGYRACYMIKSEEDEPIGPGIRRWRISVEYTGRIQV